jgi:hypothetical protein
VHSDPAIRRHWTLVCCAFTFCWWHASQVAASERLSDTGTERVEPVEEPNNSIAEKKRVNWQRQRPRVWWPVALRQVRAWLDPWMMIGRYWRVVDAATDRCPAGVA